MRNFIGTAIAITLFCFPSVALANQSKQEANERRQAVLAAKTLLQGRDSEKLDKAAFQSAIDFQNMRGRGTLLSVFLALDLDGDGSITDLELEIHKKFDHRGRPNKILNRIRDFGETPILYQQIVKLAEEELRSQGGWLDAEKLFLLFDRNNDLRITKRELNDFVRVSNSQYKASRITRRAETTEQRERMQLLTLALRVTGLPSLAQSKGGTSFGVFLRKSKRVNTSLRMKYTSQVLRFDHDADGALSTQEIEGLKADLGSRKKSLLFPEILRDEDEELTFSQVSRAAEERAKQSPRWVSNPEKLFSILDADGDGIITSKEEMNIRNEASELGKGLRGIFRR